MYLTTLDWVLLFPIGALAVIGLFKGLSGWLGTLAGGAAAAAASYLLLGPCQSAAAACPWVSGPFVRVAAGVLDFLAALIAFGLVRRLTVRFLSFLLPQPLNALVGLAGGLLLAAGGLMLLAATAVFEGGTGPLADGFLASRSHLVNLAAKVLDSRLEGAAR
ncbi:MAG: hypothetical protein IKO72_16485 [Kiritimatiellae bacterium]|nr:hypothetical protein [Kiritimatiellia bacterium]